MKNSENKFINEDEILLQRDFINKNKSILGNSKRYALVETYGCQQNVSDSEIIKGMLIDMGYEMTDDKEKADFILFNTCAIREHAELKVFGNVGALKKLKIRKPSLIIALCGCMMQQEHIQNEIEKKYRHVDIVFGTHALYRFPSIFNKCITEKVRVFDAKDSSGQIAEGLPIKRDGKFKAFVSIMYGCNNFCTYCIVPYVRGRQRSRHHEEIIKEIKELITLGVKDICLLGQNVNSYGLDLENEYNFAKLLSEIASLEGDFVVRFMTSHPKDCSKELIDVMAQSDKIANQLHLPFQCGNDKVLKDMNRHYDRKSYLELINYAKEKIKDIVLTSDVIVGFPGETFDEFMDTISLIKEVEFDSLFMFIYSRRKGTPADLMENQISKEEKKKRFEILLNEHNRICEKVNKEYIGKTIKCLVENQGKEEGAMVAKSIGGKVVHFSGDKSLIGKFINIKITQARMFTLAGEII